MSETQSDGGGSTLTVTGGNNQFVVRYTADASGGAGGPGGGAFGNPDDNRNTNPDYDFGALDGNQVYVVTEGGTDLAIEGRNKQFVVEYLTPPTGGNSVSVEGGNNQFVVAHEYA